MAHDSGGTDGICGRPSLVATDANNRDQLRRLLHHPDWEDVEDLLSQILVAQFDDFPPPASGSIHLLPI